MSGLVERDIHRLGANRSEAQRVTLSQGKTQGKFQIQASKKEKPNFINTLAEYCGQAQGN